MSFRGKNFSQICVLSVISWKRHVLCNKHFCCQKFLPDNPGEEDLVDFWLTTSQPCTRGFQLLKSIFVDCFLKEEGFQLNCVPDIGSETHQVAVIVFPLVSAKS